MENPEKLFSENFKLTSRFAVQKVENAYKTLNQHKFKRNNKIIAAANLVGILITFILVLKKIISEINMNLEIETQYQSSNFLYNNSTDNSTINQSSGFNDPKIKLDYIMIIYTSFLFVFFIICVFLTKAKSFQSEGILYLLSNILSEHFSYILCAILINSFEFENGLYITIAIDLTTKISRFLLLNSDWVMSFYGSLTNCFIIWIFSIYLLDYNSKLLYYLFTSSLFTLNGLFISNYVNKIERINFLFQNKFLSEKEAYSDLKEQINHELLTYGEKFLYANEAFKHIIELSQHKAKENIQTEIGLNSEMIKSNLYSYENLEALASLFKNFRAFNNQISTQEILNSNKSLLDYLLNYDKSSQFMYLGKLVLEQDGNLNVFLSKTYQVSFKVTENEEGKRTLNLLFKDIHICREDSHLFEIEENNSPKVFYTAKLIDDYNLIINSILKISNKIGKESECRKINSIQIKKESEYIKDISFHLSQKISDYVLFNNLSFKCTDECDEENLKICGKCQDLYCSKCKICDFCDYQRKKHFDILKLINKFKNNFITLSLIDGRPLAEIQIFSENDANIQNNSIKIAENYLNSVIFNIFNYAYINSKAKLDLKINVSRNFTFTKENIITIIQIKASSLFVSNDAIEIFSKLEDINFDKFDNKHFKINFELFVAYFMLRKIGSNLNMESTSEGTTFTFIISNKSEENNIRHSSRHSSGKYKTDDLRKMTLSEDENDSLALSIINEESIILDTSSKVQIVRRSSNPRMLGMKSKFNDIKYASADFLSKFRHDSNASGDNLDNDPSESLFLKLDLNKKTSNERRILIVDKDKSIRESLKRQLLNISLTDEKTYTFEEAENSFEAINILYKSILKGSYINIVIIEDALPLMKGSYFIRLFKLLIEDNTFYRISFILLSPESVNMLPDENDYDYLIKKPIQLKELKDKLNLC